jgi:hypothetical protein
MRRVKAKWRWHGRPAGDRKHWMAGIVRCASCGGTLIWAAPHYFKCSNYVRGSCRSTQHVPAGDLERLLLDKLHYDMAAADALDYRLVQAADGTADELSAVRRQISQTQKKKERLREAFLSGADSVEEYKEMKDVLDASLAELSAREQQILHAGAEKTPQLLRQRLSSALEILDSPEATVAQKHDAAESVIEQCTWDRATATLSITYRVVL